MLKNLTSTTLVFAVLAIALLAGNYFLMEYLIQNGEVMIKYGERDPNLELYRNVFLTWIISIMSAIWGFIVYRRFRTPSAASAAWIVNLLAAVLFMTVAMPAMDELRYYYMTGTQSHFHIIGRYVGYIILLANLVVMWLIGFGKRFRNSLLYVATVLATIFVALVVASTELTHAMIMMEYDYEGETLDEIRKIPFTVLWGSIGLIAILIGLIKKKKSIWIPGAFLIVIALLKLLLFDF